MEWDVSKNWTKEQQKHPYGLYVLTYHEKWGVRSLQEVGKKRDFIDVEARKITRDILNIQKLPRHFYLCVIKNGKYYKTLYTAICSNSNKNIGFLVASSNNAVLRI